MREAMREANVIEKEVDLYQNGDKFAVYGVFESEACNMSDTRSKIMKKITSKMTQQ